MTGMGWAQKLTDGRYRYFASHGSGTDRVTANATRPTRKEAKAAAEARLDHKLRAASFPEARSLSLSTYLKRYAAHYATHSESEWAAYLYEQWTKKLPPELAKKRLADLTTAYLQLWVDSLATDHAPTTVRKEHQNLSTALARAVDWGLLADNPMSRVRCPKQEQADHWIPDEAETVALLERLEGSRLWAPALVAATTGLRRGELLALRWQDVDEGSLRVERAAEYSHKAGKVVFKVPKTKKSRRTVALLSWTQDCLKAHRQHQVAARLKAKVWHEHGLVFPRRDGEPWSPPSFSRLWQSASTGVRFHDLRHAHATHLLRSGVPMTAVSGRLGHSSVAITARVYSHVLPDDDAAAVVRLEQKFSAGS